MCFLSDTLFRVITFQREHKPARAERRDSEDGARYSRELNGNINGKGRSDPLSTPESLLMKESNHLGLGIKEWLLLIFWTPKLLLTTPSPACLSLPSRWC
ncbi:hypothetical protein PHYPO_G00185940 [Pangasianodon hypophthalmus]|uniref:Uncharacterized protein n=1 Tax=Pangasianodon hypophthalmus TaxID=310915 RepID=A0A5N5JEP4_PANHP|nr:hypothetical protein PHYPO_G00185940 [Pangasianodon hypophthalmus]